MGIEIKRVGSDITTVAPVAVSAANLHRPAANTAAIVTYAGAAGLKHALTGIAWSYSGTPVSGSVTIEDGAGTPILQLDILHSGYGDIQFVRPIKSSAAHLAMVITLTPGGAGVIGKMNVINHWTEA